MITLQQILELVGALDDSQGENTARARFRKFLSDSVPTIGALRDYIETCLRTPGQQYNRALQDLVNHAARLMHFEVEFGRYQGVVNDIGYDGIWRSKNLDIVIEVKTTDAYAIRTSTLLGYVDQLIADRRLENWDRTLGLYLVGRPDVELKQLENAIIAEKRTNQLRVATIESLLVLGELASNESITHEEVVSLLRPAGVSVDNTVRLLARVAGSLQQQVEEPPEEPPSAPTVQVGDAEAQLSSGDRHYLMTPVADEEGWTAEDCIRELLGSGWYVFGERTPGRRLLKPGDRICFYRSAVGVVADAEVASEPERKIVPDVNAERFPWAFKVRNERYYFDAPIVIDAALRAKLDAFKKANAEAPWGWFVVSTKIVSKHDYALLTGMHDTRPTAVHLASDPVGGLRSS